MRTRTARPQIPLDRDPTRDFTSRVPEHPRAASAHPLTAPRSGRGAGARPLEATEAALVVVVCGHLCFLPWALGAMHLWSQSTSLILSMLGFALGLVSGRQEGLTAGRLARSPLLWVALLWLAYLAVQGANPAWRFTSDAANWWLEPIAHIGWLPSGVDAPLHRSNPWRSLLIHGSLLLLAGSVWIGFTRRRSYRILLTVLSGNALLLALLGLLQRFEGSARIFWMHRPSNNRFVASFIYPNHGGPYFYLMTAVATGLAWWCLRRPARPMQGLAQAVIAALCSVLVLHTQSRMSVLLLGLFWALFAAAVIWRMLRRKDSPAAPARRRAYAVAGLGLLVALPLAVAPTARILDRFSESARLPETTGADRQMARQATADMLRDRLIFGWGAGCFRHVFPLYAQHYPTIYENPNGWRRYWEHAHCDWLEFPAELGLVGSVPLMLLLAWLARQLARARCWRNPVSLSLSAGCSLPLLHATVDFVFQNPALLFTWAVLLVTAIRWAGLESSAPTPAAAQTFT